MSVPQVRRQMPEPTAACEVAALRSLWAAVLYEQLRLALRAEPEKVKYTGGDIETARRWIGGPDFRICCSLAGLDPDYVEDGVRARMQTGVPLRKRLLLRVQA